MSVREEIKEALAYNERTTGRRPALLRFNGETYGKLREEIQDELKWDAKEKHESFEGIPIEIDNTVPSDLGFLLVM